MQRRREDRVRRTKRQLLRLRDEGRSRIVDQHVDRRCAPRRIHHRIDRGAVANVATDRADLAAGPLTHLGGGRPEQLEPAAANDEFGAKLEKAAPHRRTEPRTAAGDQDAFPFQQAFFKHSFTPIFLSSSLRGAKRRSNPYPGLPRHGLLRGACHRARIRATRWLAVTRMDLPSIKPMKPDCRRASNPAWIIQVSRPFEHQVRSMKAILCSQYCQPDDLVLADVPDPVAGPGEAVIAIKAAALNFFDILMIQGKYQIKPPFPFSPAAEIAGVVESVGAGVTAVKVGDRVVASCGHNGARE